MKREFKFRAWNIPSNYMYYNIQKGVIAENAKGEIIIGTSFDTICKDAGSEVMQFTGAKDNEGKEIYEGDIIEFDINERGGTDNKFQVTWDKEDCSFNFGGGSTVGDMEFIKVIGNIYENSDLLN